ncbi:YidH family protein [Methylocystis parvus]|uniref:DUF202 domain-containing protein n=1 Tax=Methylocystis parvus TaxID=134 RepID=A0A6B8M2R2_9HYPH|nr:DUF202 domain-containing protein [Methylocystis parvus]QGM99167.1 DUF202 domain-containing protein [Methylocystis parvus]WBK00459.1 DUF202 domain-containing protein [Methylocystis parvus OBBP]
MIRDFTNYAANERTFLAWVRTGIAVVALGFVIERFNLFLIALASASGAAPAMHGFRQFATPSGRYGGMALVGAGVLMIVIATIRFLQTARLLEDGSDHPPRRIRTTLFALSAIVMGVAFFSGYLAIG